MLVLSRKKEETIVIDGQIEIQVLKVKGNSVRLGIRAPENVKILRGEVSPFDVSFEVSMEEFANARESSAEEKRRRKSSPKSLPKSSTSSEAKTDSQTDSQAGPSNRSSQRVPAQAPLKSFVDGRSTFCEPSDENENGSGFTNSIAVA